MIINSDLCHDNLLKKQTQKLGYNDSVDYKTWKQDIKAKAVELLGLDKIKENACPMHYEIESEETMDGYKRIRFVVETERDNFVPCYLLIPDTGKEKYPVAIVLQGHKKGGMYHSVGIEKEEGDAEYQQHGAFALQAVKNGFAAVTMELRGMGELLPNGPKKMWGDMCKYTASVAMMIGRTLQGERIWDISRLIDVLPNFEKLDTSDITLAGMSGGGTLTFYAGCMEDRITYCVPTCAYCPFPESILAMYHCICNYVPHAYEWYDMDDLSCMIAPKKLLILSGEKDIIFPIDGVKRGLEKTKKFYELEGKPENLRFATMPRDHYWCDDIVWKEINDFRKQK